MGSMEQSTLPSQTSSSVALPHAVQAGLPVSEPMPEFWIMIDLGGYTLQEARDSVATLTSSKAWLRTAPIDGAGRHSRPVIDDEWRVCSQSPQPGEWIGLDSVIKLWVAPNTQARP